MNFAGDDPATLVGSVGVALLLLAFVLNMFKVLRTDTTAYLALNLVGASLACYSSYLIRFTPFVVLEGVWAAAALVALARGFAGNSKIGA